MKHIVSLSGGVSSAVACDRVIERYGRDQVEIWFADTLWEDADLYRFLDDLMVRWGGVLIREALGLTPLEVAEKRGIIPDSRTAPCSDELKIKIFKKFLLRHDKPVTVHIGMDYTEMHRFEKPRKNYGAISGVSVDFPLMWEPWMAGNYFDIVRSWGIAVPRLYEEGFSHNNCGGRCVRQGIREWSLLKRTHPDRFDQVAAWEAAQRGKGGKLSERTILKSRKRGGLIPLPLFEVEAMSSDPEPSREDAFSCHCTY